MANNDINKKTGFAWAKYYEMKEKHDELLAKNIMLEKKVKNAKVMDDELINKQLEYMRGVFEEQYKKSWFEFEAKQIQNDKMYKDKIRKLEGALQVMSEVEKGDDAKVRKLKNALKSMTSV